MEVYEAMLTRRTIRKFTRQPIERADVERMLEAARLSPSASNRQPLKYVAVLGGERCDRIFKLTKFAGYLPEAGPSWEQRPGAYIALLIDKRIIESADTDAGAAMENILLTAWADGIGSCWMAAVDRPAILGELGLDPAHFALHSVAALGYPAEGSREAPMRGGDVKYFYDENGDFRVPKRTLDEIASIIDG